MTKIVVGIRGATTVDCNRREAVLEKTEELFVELVKENDLTPGDVAAVFLTTTPDIDAAFPALAVRSLNGWRNSALLGAVEMKSEQGPARCIRVLILANRDNNAPPPVFKYLHDAKNLRNAAYD